MSAKTQLLSESSGGMNVEGWCVLAMGALFGLFLLGVWWELRRNLRSISRQAQQSERSIAKLESRLAFERELERQAASRRVAALRAVKAEPAPVLVQAHLVQAQSQREEEEEAAGSGLGLESIGRILERLAQAAPSVEHEIEVPAFAAANSARPALNMVRGGKSESKIEAGERSCEAVGVEEAHGAAAQSAPARRNRSAASGARAKARDAVKSSSIGSSSIGSNSIGSGALVASR